MSIINHSSIRLMLVLSITTSLAGCLSSLKKTYEESEEATKLVYESTKSLFDDKNNNTPQAKQSTSKVKTSKQTKAVKQKKSPGQIQQETLEAKYEHITLESPAPESIKSVRYRSHKGFYISELPKIFRGENRVPYYQLLALKDAKPQFNAAKLKKLYDGKSGVKMKSDADLKENYWYLFLTRMAPKVLTYPRYDEYMCKSDERPVPKQSCYGNYDMAKGHWSITGTVFEKKRAFNNFIDNEMDKLFELAALAKHTVYLKGSARVSTYQFEDGGFIVTRIRPLMISPNNKEVAKLSIFSSKKYSKTLHGKLLKMNEGEAEKFSRKLKANNNSLYYIYKVQLKVGPQSYIYKTRTYNVGAMKYGYDVLSKKMEFYFDDALTKKAFELPIN